MKNTILHMIARIFVPEVLEMLQKKQFKSVKEILLELNEQDIVDLLSLIPAQESALLFRLLPKSVAVDVFGGMDSDLREDLIKAFHEGELLDLLEEMPPDERTELFEEMPASFVRRYISKLSPEERNFSTRVLNYPEDSVARIVTDEYLTLQRDISVQDALKTIRQNAQGKETIYYCYVIDETLTLIGVVSLKQILLARDDERVSNLLQKNVVSIQADADQEEALALFKKYDFLAMPVVDRENRILGIMTFDDVMDVDTEEATEDIQKMAGLLPTEDTYLQTGFFSMVWKRLVWLVVFLFTEIISSSILSHHSDVLQQMVALTFFIPLLLGTGGNTGSQMVATVIRSLATGEICMRDFFRVFKREVLMGLTLGILLALLAFMRGYFLHVPMGVSLAVGFSLILIVLIANLAGVILPFLFKMLKMDPAVMSGPLMATVVDVFGLIIYLEIAKYFLRL